MRVLLLNQTFHPDVAATAQHAHDLARHLVARGHDVTVVASRSIYGQTGAALPRRQTIDGIDVHRVGVSLFGKRGLAARLADFALFYAAAAARVLSMGVLPRDAGRADVVVAFTTPPMIALVGWLHRVLWDTPYVYWVMDLYPDVAVASGVMRPTGPATRLAEALGRFCLTRADAVVVLGRCMRQRVLARGVQPRRVTTINVWADADELAPLDPADNPLRRQWGLEGKFAVMYSGNMGVGHDFAPIQDAILRLRDRDDLRFVFVGAGRQLPELRAFVERHGLTNTLFLPYQPREKLRQTLAAGDAHLVSQFAGLTGMIVPSKLYGVLAAARPVLFLGDPASEAGRVVAEAQAGAVLPADGAALADAIQRLAAEPDAARATGARGREALLARYDRPIACDAWARLLESLGPAA